METQSFVANVNKLATHLDTFVSLNSNLPKDYIDPLYELSKKNLDPLVEDISKGTYSGFRKISIDLFKNYSEYSEDMTTEEKGVLYGDVTKAPKYNKIIVTTSITQEEVPVLIHDGVNEVTEISTNEELYQFLISDTFKLYMQGTHIAMIPDTVVAETIQMYDETNVFAYLKSVQLVQSSGGTAKETSPIYSWARSTSSLDVMVNYLSDIKYSINQLELIGELSEDALSLLTNINVVQDHLDETYAKLIELNAQYDKVTTDLQELTVVWTPMDADSVNATQGSVSYNPTTNTLDFIVPRGPEGVQGIEGRQGIQGEQGIQGLKGDKGEQGEPAPEGAKGPTGDPGPIGSSALAQAFGNFRINAEGELVLDYLGDITSASVYAIDADGHLTVEVED